MKGGQYLGLLFMILVVQASCDGRHRQRRRTEHVEEQPKPLNKYQPNTYLTAAPQAMPDFEEDDGPALYSLASSQYPGFQIYVRRYPKIFLETVHKPNIPQYVTRGMEMDNIVRLIVTTTPNGFPEYVSAMLDVYSDIEEGINVKKEKEKSSRSGSDASSSSRSRSASTS